MNSTIDAFNEASFPPSMIVISVMPQEGVNVCYNAKFWKPNQMVYVNQTVNGVANGGACPIDNLDVDTVKNWAPGKITSVQLLNRDFE